MFKDKWTINISTSLCRKDRCFKSLRVQQLHAHLQTKPLLCPDLQLICRLIDAVRHVSISVLDGNGERRCSTEICVGDWLANQERNSFFLIPIEAAEVSKRIILIDKQTKAYRFIQHILVQYLKYSESYSFFFKQIPLWSLTTFIVRFPFCWTSIYRVFYTFESFLFLFFNCTYQFGSKIHD